MTYPAGHFHVALPERRHRMDWDLWFYSLGQLIRTGYPAVDIYRDNRAEIGLFAAVDEIQHEGLLAMLGRSKHA